MIWSECVVAQLKDTDPQDDVCLCEIHVVVVGAARIAANFLIVLIVPFFPFLGDVL